MGVGLGGQSGRLDLCEGSRCSVPDCFPTECSARDTPSKLRLCTVSEDKEIR